MNITFVVDGGWEFISEASSTRLQRFLNPQLFLSGYGFRPHVSGESRIRIHYKSGIVWTLNPHTFLSTDVTRSSPVPYLEYCIQDANSFPGSLSYSSRVKESTLLFAFFFDFWADSSIILAIKSRIITQGRARCKFRALYDACSVANIPRGVLGTRVNSDTCGKRLDTQIRFKYGYVTTWKFWIQKEN